MPERLSARAVIETVATGFAEFDYGPVEYSEVDGPISWPGYDEAHAKAAKRTGESESVVCGHGRIGGTEAAVIAFEFGFLGGSMGGRTGDRVEAAFVRARELRLPLVFLIATGGSRMQEGMRALSQLQRVARQIALTREAGLPQIAVLRDPATGGGWATLGAGADVTLALSQAQVGFAGSRVRPPGDAHAYTAEAQYESGHIDAVVEPDELPGVLASWLGLLAGPAATEAPVPPALGRKELPETGWEAVRNARAAERPRAQSYLDHYFDEREEISGDLCGGRDPGVLCGFGKRNGETIAYVTQAGTPTLPSGFRTAARLVSLADRLGLPILTIVDTLGAANDAAAEGSGAGPSIAELFLAVASAKVPITSLVIGEGGSGGALAFAAPGRTWMTPDSYFSVTSPEAAASILKRDPSEVPETANQLRLRPQDVVELGVAQGIAPHVEDSR
ncbi:carboxyl transferase domain-containing protein [Amycolatopsis sp. 195334CR]|uniref:carboxyl transferase domain-containing protein n=1 Tax=Amycolatopsis sp. 195334CR TaxID=2814588 RepID=UPI001A8F67E3|nr:carboxyl transferase domain-containing protein [Amycolatopsis sp. 195334CR]MBN6036404.1 acetyl-CoA carboxylase [Amycolatopsis sp. 195334CR]